MTHADQSRKPQIHRRYILFNHSRPNHGEESSPRGIQAMQNTKDMAMMKVSGRIRDNLIESSSNASDSQASTHLLQIFPGALQDLFSGSWEPSNMETLHGLHQHSISDLVRIKRKYTPAPIKPIRDVVVPALVELRSRPYADRARKTVARKFPGVKRIISVATSS
jgi:hypothetical protein